MAKCGVSQFPDFAALHPGYSSRHCRKMFGEPIETLAPAPAMAVARFVRGEAGLFERDFGAAAHLFEADRDQRFGPGLAVLLPGVRHHQTRARHDLAIGAAKPMLAAIRIAPAAAPLAADTQVALAPGDRIAARRRPGREMLLLGEAAPYEVDRRVEHARQHEAIARSISHAAFAAFSIVAMSIFFIVIIACMARLARSGSLAGVSVSSASGVICQERPYLSLSQPHWDSCPPPAVSASQYLSTSAWSLHFTTIDTASLNLKCGPPLSAMSSSSCSVNVMVMTVPFGSGPASL